MMSLNCLLIRDAVLSCGKWVPVFCEIIWIITDVRSQTVLSCGKWMPVFCTNVWIITDVRSQTVLSCGKSVPVFCTNVWIITDVRPQTLQDKYCFKIRCFMLLQRFFLCWRWVPRSLAGQSRTLSSPARILGSWVRIPLEAWMSAFFSVFVMSCVKVAALRRANPPSKESYGMCTRLRNWKKRPGPNRGL
jgi:hypothetical protein